MKWVINEALPSGKNIFLYFAAIIVHIASFSVGLIFAWTTPVASKLQSTVDNPLGVALTLDQISWLASLVPLGAILGPFAGGYMADAIGRKHSLTLSLSAAILSFSTLAFGSNLYLFYSARFIGGMCAGIFLTVVPMYIGEIAEIRNRGTLGSLIGLFIVIGNLYCFSIGPYISVKLFSLSCMVAPIIFLMIGVPFLPESPCYLIVKDRQEEAKKSLMKLRCGDVENELTELTASVKESLEESGGISDIFKTPHLRKGLLVTIGLMITQQTTAFVAIIFYMHSIFEKSGFTLSKEVATIIVGAVQTIANLSSSMIIDRLGRRPLVLASSSATCLSLITLSAYFYLSLKIDVGTITWLPMVAIMIYMFFYNIGLGPVPPTILGEIFPAHVKSAAASLSVASALITCFGVTKLFPTLVSLVDTWFAFTFFGLCNLTGIIFIWRQLPETKGRTLAEILESLK